VSTEQDRWRQRMEWHPTGFMTYELPQALREVAMRLAAFVGGLGKDFALIENATAGCNTVLNCLHLFPGDEILSTNHSYPAVRNAAKHAASKAGAKVVEVSVPFPVSDPSQIIEAVASKLGPRTGLVILDHVTSPTAIIFPVRELTSLCHAAGAYVLIDGAHGPGMLSLDIASIGADWYVGNCHKWLMAPKGSAFLWANPKRQADMHPPVISHGYGQGFTAEFDWTGTRDPSAWLAVPAAIDFHNQIGGPSLRKCEVGARVCDTPGHSLEDGTRFRRLAYRLHGSGTPATQGSGKSRACSRAACPTLRGSANRGGHNGLCSLSLGANIGAGVQRARRL
jgi:isopenicillin-N epimerase